MIFIRLLIVFFLSCSSSDDIDYDLPDVRDFNENKIGNPVITITRKNIPIVKAKSKILIKNSTSDALLKGDVRAYFFDEDGKHVSELSSDSAKINQKTNNLHAYGNVKVISDDSLKLFSNSILWDNHYKLIISHDSVMFTSENNDTMYGIGFESDMDLNRWKIKKPHGTKNSRTK